MKETIKKAVESLQEFVDTRKNLREWKRGEAVRLRLLGFSYSEIQLRLNVNPDETAYRDGQAGSVCFR